MKYFDNALMWIFDHTTGATGDWVDYINALEDIGMSREEVMNEVYDSVWSDESTVDAANALNEVYGF